MKKLFTFLLGVAMLSGTLTPAQAQSKIISIQWTSGKPSPDTVYASSSQSSAGARAVCQTTLTAEGGPTGPVCAGTNLVFNRVGASNPCGLDSSMPTTLELSDASGDFTNPIVLKRGTGEVGLAFALRRTDGAGVILPANLPAGTQYVIRLNNPKNGVSSSSTPFTVIAAPSVSITASSTAICASQSAQLTAGGADTYTWSTRQTSNPISVTTTGAYSVTGIATNGCSGTATVSIINRPLPTRYPIVGSGLYCEGGSGRLVRLAGSQTGVDYQLLLNNNPIGSPVPGTGSALSFGNQTASGTYTALATYPGSSCQQIMPGGAVIGIAPIPNAPSLVTASGYAYPAGVTALTISQNVGPVSLTATGCTGGMITANGDAASSLTVTTAMTGTQTYTATCTQNGCTSPAASFELTVVPTTLSVLHRDADYGNLNNNIIKPYLQLANASDQAIPYGELTVRYWLTSEGNALPTNLAVYYAKLGAVNVKYVPLSQPRQGALGYVEYSFPGGGSLPANGNSGPIENGIQKTDGSVFNESDDYSYQANYANYVTNTRVTAYRNGTIIWGQDPIVEASRIAVQVFSAAKDAPITSQIQTRVELRNTGNVPLSLSSLRIRYYFTSDNGRAADTFVDYADIGTSNVMGQLARLAGAYKGADQFLELRFPGNTMQLNALSSLGAIDFRILRSDNGLLDQNNDYSFQANYGNVALNNRIIVFFNDQVIFGTLPSEPAARIGASEPGMLLQARVLGNPVVGSRADVEITGVAGQAVSLKLVDLQGRLIHEQRIEQARELEPVSLPLGSSRGQLLLRVSTDTQQQSLKLLRP